MTVNERLYDSGLINQYLEAVKEKDIKTAIAILRLVDLGEENINAILKFDGMIDG